MQSDPLPTLVTSTYWTKKSSGYIAAQNLLLHANHAEQIVEVLIWDNRGFWSQRKYKMSPSRDLQANKKIKKEAFFNGEKAQEAFCKQLYRNYSV